MVIRSLVVDESSTWLLHIHGHPINILLIPSISVFPLTIKHDSVISDLLTTVNKLTTCVGNPELAYVNLGKAKKNGEFLSIGKQAVAFVDSNATVTIDQQVYAVTVRCVDCCLLISEGVRCSPCQNFRKNLQTKYRRSIVEKLVENQKTNLRYAFSTIQYMCLFVNF